MNAVKIGAIAVVLIFLATGIGAFAVGYNTENETNYSNPTATTYAKEYDHEGLTIVNDYTNDNYTINTTTTDNVGYIVSDKAIVDFRPTESNVSIKYGTYTDTLTGTYGTSITSMTLVYYNDTITITTNIETKTIQNVDKIYLINRVISSSEYYVYSGNIATSYYAHSDRVLSYGTSGNGYLFSGTTLKLGNGQTATASSTSSDTEFNGIKKYMSNTTPITISGVSDQSTILEKSIKATNGETYHREYLIGGIALIVVLIGLCVAIFNRDR